MFSSQAEHASATLISFYRGWHLHVACGSCSVTRKAIPVDHLIRQHPRATVGEVLALLTCRSPHGRGRGCGGSPGFVSLIHPAASDKEIVLVDTVSPDRQRPIFQVKIAAKSRTKS